MKKICFFSGDITRSGGTERVSTIIANGLAKSGKYEVLFLSIMEKNDTPFFSIDSEIKRYVLKENKKGAFCWLEYSLLIPALRRFFKKKSIDVVIDIDLILDSVSIPASAGLFVKVVSWEHFHYYYERKKFYRKSISRFSARFSDYIITLTPRDRQNYREKLHRLERIDFIYNPLEEAFTDIPLSLPREKLLLTVGWLNAVKGVDLLAQIIPQILCKHSDWKWAFLGDGEYRNLLERTARQYHIEDRLLLEGTVSRVEEYFKRSSICVLGSRTESFGMCLLEAKACHVPCIAFDVPYGPSEIIEDKLNGFLIPPFNLDKMAKKINLLIENQGLREAFAKNTTVGMDKFQLGPILEKWDALLIHILNL